MEAQGGRRVMKYEFLFVELYNLLNYLLLYYFVEVFDFSVMKYVIRNNCVDN